MKQRSRERPPDEDSVYPGVASNTAANLSQVHNHKSGGTQPSSSETGTSTDSSTANKDGRDCESDEPCDRDGVLVAPLPIPPPSPSPSPNSGPSQHSGSLSVMQQPHHPWPSSLLMHPGESVKSSRPPPSNASTGSSSDGLSTSTACCQDHPRHSRERDEPKKRGGAIIFAKPGATDRRQGAAAVTSDHSRGGGGGESDQQGGGSGVQDGEGGSMCGVRILLVTNKKKDLWILPSGTFEDRDVTMENCAVREIYEEAGVRCCVLADLGEYTASDNRSVTTYFLVRCEEELAEWPEMDQRDRMWVEVSEACEHLKRDVDLRAFEHARKIYQSLPLRSDVPCHPGPPCSPAQRKTTTCPSS